jgi:hypothetical protein
MRSRSLLLATFLAAGTTLMFSAAADAQGNGNSRHNDREVRNYCDNHPRDRDCQAHRRGDNSTVGNILRKTGNVITGAGRVVGSVIEAGVCDARHKNYDQGTNTYIGKDGRRHRC